MLIGIDEAGRGPLAGPVAVGIAAAYTKFDRKLLRGIRDSKQLSEEAREMWFEKLELWKEEGILDFHAVLISAHHIDTHGISHAIRTGIKKCLKKIKADPATATILLDGSLKAPPEFQNQTTIIKGDEKEPMISLASIAAKVTRDRHMKKISKKYKKYDFHVHKGYGTVAHRRAIAEFGPSDIHRLTFLKNILK